MMPLDATASIDPVAARVPEVRRKEGRWLRLKAYLSAALLAVVAFLAGIFFTILLLRTPLADTPLDIVQRPILKAAGIPADAHKEWLALEQSFEYVDHFYYDQAKIDHKEMIYHAAESAVSSLGDRFTAFNRPVVAKSNNDFISGKFVGVGLVAQISQGHYLVKRVIGGSPVEKAGIKEGDILVAINAQPVPDNISEVNSISEKLQGAVNTKVKLTFQRPSDANRATEYELTRQELVSPSVDARLLPGTNIVYIEMNRVFGENTIKEFDSKVGELAKNNPDGYILDMRGNGGGLVDAARQLVGRFLPDGVVYYEDAPINQTHMKEIDLLPSTELKIYDKPLVILEDGGSASATEITTAALHDRKRATVIGQQSFGKGSAQNVLQLPGQSYLRVTFEHWFTPGKVNLYDSKGIKPDIEVVLTDEQRKQNLDPQLDRAIQFLTQKS